jgi:hypothetical protein
VVDCLSPRHGWRRRSLLASSGPNLRHHSPIAGLYDEILFVDPMSARVRDRLYPEEHLQYLPPDIPTWLATEWSGIRDELGDASLRVAPIDKGWRQERVRVALPRLPAESSETARGNIDGNDRWSGTRVVPQEDAGALPARRRGPAAARRFARGCGRCSAADCTGAVEAETKRARGTFCAGVTVGRFLVACGPRRDITERATGRRAVVRRPGPGST